MYCENLLQGGKAAPVVQQEQHLLFPVATAVEAATTAATATAAAATMTITTAAHAPVAAAATATAAATAKETAAYIGSLIKKNLLISKL